MINAHSGEKTFECEVCNKAFATKNDLKNHKARHVNVRNFQCDLCTKTFKTKHDRDKHAKRCHAKVSKSQDKSDLTPAMRKDDDNSLEVGLSGLEAREKIANKAQGHNEGKINKADDDTIGVSFDSDSNFNRATDLDSDERTAHMLTDVMDNCVKSSELLKSKKSQDRTDINGVSDKENATAVDNVDCIQTIEIHDVASQLKDKQCQRVTKNSCKICHKTFTSDGNFKRHMYSHSDKLPYTCSVCKKGFPRTDYLNIHVINVHTGKKLFECDVCKRTFATNHYMKKHRISHTKFRQFKCGTCEKTYKNRSDVRKHIKAKHLLSKSLFSKSDIHFEDDTGENDNDVVDNGLENQIEELDEERDRNLNKEKNSDQEDRNANNDLAKTSNGIDYRSSKYTEEDTDQEKAFEIKSNCNNITVELKQKEKAPNVLGKQFSCEICKKEFASRKSQKRHQLLHSNTLPFTCSSCGKGFPRKEALHLHTVSAHGGKKDFQCEICKKSFATKNYLINHRLIHSLERKFPCQFCKKSSKTHTDLIKHVKRIHPEKLSKNFTVQKHTCQFCGTNSKTNDILLRHIQRMHPKEFKK
jgi:KRAB domain-containing zinc finger protein